MVENYVVSEPFVWRCGKKERGALDGGRPKEAALEEQHGVGAHEGLAGLDRERLGRAQKVSPTGFKSV